MKAPLLCAALLAPSLAFPDGKSDLNAIEAKLDKCRQSAASKVAWRNCLMAAVEDANKVLNRSYQGQVAPLTKHADDPEIDRGNSEILRRLKASQNAWLAFRAENAKLAGARSLGDTDEPAAIVHASYDMTRARVLYLEALFGDQDPTFATEDLDSDLAAIQAKYDACGASDRSKVDVENCLGARVDDANKVLNRDYQRYVSISTKRTQSPKWNNNFYSEFLRRLVASQNAWLAFRTANAKLAAASSLGGTGEGMEIVLASYQMTIARVLELRGCVGSVLEPGE